MSLGKRECDDGAKHEGCESGALRCSSEVSQASLQLDLFPKINIEQWGGKWTGEGIGRA